jgi:excisionase family DNA binding protein
MHIMDIGSRQTYAPGEMSVKDGPMTVRAPSTPKVLRRGEAAERLGVHPNTLAGWVTRGWLTGVRMPSGEVRFREEEVNALRDRIYAV